MSRSQEDKFEKLLLDREKEKRENVRVKLMHDLDVIRFRKSCNATITPLESEVFPSWAFERFKRNNIWEKILVYITDPSDMTSVYHTCPTFRKHQSFAERRLSKLLPKALEVMAEEGYLHDEVKQGGGRGKLRKINCLGLRGVSKAISESANKQFFDSDFSHDAWYLRFRDHGTGEMCTFSNEGSVERVRLLLSGHGHTSSSPCLLRKLSVREPKAGEDLNSFYRKVLDFLDLYGDSIWLFMYEGGRRNNNATSYEALRNMVIRLPRLKAIILQSVTYPFRGEGLWETIQQFPFPALESLQFIHVLREHEYLMKEIFQKCVNLKCVLWEQSLLHSEGTERALARLNLERYFEPSFEQTFFASSVLMSDRLTLTWPLKVLQLNQYIPIRCSELWPVLNKFRETLEHLEIGTVVEKDSPHVTLRLDRLKYLLFKSRKEDSMDFEDLLHLKALERVVIIGRKDDDLRSSGCGKSLIQFNGRLGLECSNIWKCFPNLKQVEFRLGICPLTSRSRVTGYLRCGNSVTRYDRGKVHPMRYVFAVLQRFFIWAGMFILGGCLDAVITMLCKGIC